MSLKETHVFSTGFSSSFNLCPLQLHSLLPSIENGWKQHKWSIY
ncbi:hypothetical protein BVRB_8g184980 [Beta vulgaris subsp. vulgaris]|uniref:Uncharacterized protein n=1 Tax=Beta vulgaris subsp. vulgaris TaxID=3555 RepID=A0A0J8BW98_BETVV|nr:hypothetical protein BVRB_8g184980 [Beta vulgaris subsp. vulgaris]